jgi:putative spermidine/putrescine transport system permease protein
LHGVYLTALENSIELSLVTAILSGAGGLFLAWAVVSGRGSVFQRLVSSGAAVLANFGGLPLAFLFIAMIGNAGVATKVLSNAGISLSDDLHFHLYSLVGVEFVYLYFMIPLMVLVITPALEGLRPQWQEAARNLGATGWQYWRHVAGPVLAPNLAGSVALLFCSSFSAFATADALTNGTLSLTPLQISSELSGNVLAGAQAQNIAAALALDMIIVVVPLTLLYQAMQRRTTRWLQ